jgi:hypothetical protein
MFGITLLHLLWKIQAPCLWHHLVVAVPIWRFSHTPDRRGHTSWAPQQQIPVEPTIRQLE